MQEKVLDGRSPLAKAIKGQIYEELREALTKPSGKSKLSWTQSFLKKMLEEAQTKPNSPVGQLIAKQLMSEDILDKLDSETDKYLSRDIDFNEFRLLKTLYDKQRDVYLDGDARKIIIGSRRIGKTELAARLLIKECLRPNRHALFISLKFENAIRQCYTLVDDLVTSLGLPVAHKSKSEGEITFTNGSYILFKGNANNAEASKLLGYKYSLVVVDEVQNQCNLKFLLDDVLRPTMIDYEDSHLICIGTPPRTPKTLCESIWNEWKGWKKYSWDLTKNPYIKNPQKVIDDICAEKGISEDNPFIQREYKGLFFYDTEAMVFNGYKTYKDLPDSFVPDRIYIGADWGFNDYTAFIPLLVDTKKQVGYVLSEKKFNHSTAGLAMDEVVNLYKEMQRLLVEKNPLANLDNVSIICDTNESMMLYELVTKRKVRAYGAYKYDKEAGMSQLVDLVRTKIFVPEEGVLSDEFQRTVYKRDEQDNILNEIDDEVFHPDAIDALLYASRQFVFDARI